MISSFVAEAQENTPAVSVAQWCLPVEFPSGPSNPKPNNGRSSTPLRPFHVYHYGISACAFSMINVILVFFTIKLICRFSECRRLAA